MLWLFSVTKEERFLYWCTTNTIRKYKAIDSSAYPTLSKSYHNPVMVIRDYLE
jgi:hypothetical protein